MISNMPRFLKRARNPWWLSVFVLKRTVIAALAVAIMPRYMGSCGLFCCFNTKTLSGASGKLRQLFPQSGVHDGEQTARRSVMTLRVRDLHAGEAEALARMTRSRTLGAGVVRRAQIVQHAVDGLNAPEIAASLDVCEAAVRFWLKRFNARGLPGLKEARRSGRPPTYTPAERSAVIAAALSRPADLDLPFACWTLDRLVAHLSEKGIGMKRSRISEILLAEGLTWRQEETWFGARVDPDF